MYQVIDEHLCLSVRDWCAAGLTYDQFRHDSSRGFLSIYRRGIHGETMIDVWSVKRSDRLAAIERAFGCRGERDNKAKHTELVRDNEAFDYYRNYRYGDDQSLPAESIEKYTNNATIIKSLLKRIGRILANGRIGKGRFWSDAVSYAIEMQTKGFPNTLPENSRSFERLAKRYLNDGYSVFISKAFGNDAAVRLNQDSKDWIVARFATPIDKLTIKQLFEEYNAVAPVHGWNLLKSENTIRKYLNQPDVRPLWYGMRYGELKAKEMFCRQHSTMLPECRDAIWYGDGTKMNYYYRDEQGKVATCNVYEVVDAYSEVLLGYHISKSEDFEAQYFAYKMAMKASGHKPYEIRFDNQGGHGKLKNGHFFENMAQLAIATQPYNGKSKTIESIFGRFQSEYLKHDWYFTGQNVTAKKMESKANMEFILANKDRFLTFEEVKKQYERRRTEWNEAVNPTTGKRRIDMYRESVNAKSPVVSLADMLDLFGIMDDKNSCTYRADGINKTIKGIKYKWEVLTADGQPDLEFLRNNVGRAFYVEYDPTDMSTIALFVKDGSGRMRFVTFGQKYIEVHRAKQEQDSLDSKFIKQMEIRNKEMRVGMMEQTEALMEKYGLHPSQHGLTMPTVKGVEKKSERSKSGKVKGKSIGEWTKAESNIVADLDGDYNYLDNY